MEALAKMIESGDVELAKDVAARKKEAAKKRYVMLCNDGSFFKDLITPLEKITRPGSYQWFKAFDSHPDWSGEVRHINSMSTDEIKSYDIVHINTCGANLHLIGNVRQVIGPPGTSKTKLIVNIDYPPDSASFCASFFNPNTFLGMCYHADFIFAQEPYQQAVLTYIMNHTNISSANRIVESRDKEDDPDFQIPLIPHPCNTTQLKKLRVGLEERQDRLIYCFHRYELQTHVPGWLTLKLKTEGGEFIPRYLTGFVPDETIRGSIAPMYLFDYVGTAISEANWGKFIYTLSHSTIGFEYYVSVHSHSRFPEECACFGVPCVGTDRAYSMVQFFPQLTFDPVDIPGIRAALERLIKDEAFYLDVIQYADQAVENISWDVSRERLLAEMQVWDARMAQGAKK